MIHLISGFLLIVLDKGSTLPADAGFCFLEFVFSIHRILKWNYEIQNLFPAWPEINIKERSCYEKDNSDYRNHYDDPVVRM